MLTQRAHFFAVASALERNMAVDRSASSTWRDIARRGADSSFGQLESLVPRHLAVQC